MPRRFKAQGLMEVSWPPVFAGAAGDTGHGAVGPNPGDRDRAEAIDDQHESQRAYAALLRVIVRSARRGEHMFNWARLAVATLCLVVWFSATYERRLASDLWVYSVCAFAIAMSALALVVLSRRQLTLAFLYASVVLDAAITGGLAVGLFLFAEGDDFGMPKTVGVWAALLTLVASGFRLSRRVAIAGIVAHALWFVPLAIADLSRPAAQEYLGRDWAIFGALALAAGMFGVLIAVRTRRLSLEVATNALSAERSRALLGAYVSEEVADHALSQKKLKLGGERLEAAVLFSDLRGFTRYAESLPPEDLVSQLNGYLRAIVDAIRAEGGVVDKYIGDAVMAVFGVPHPASDDAQRAVRAAVGMQQALAAHNAERAGCGLLPLRHGIGVHYGSLIAGNVGTAERASFTVIGDTVNVASRLESSTKTIGVDVLVSEDAARAAGMGVDATCPALVSAGVIEVKGRVQALRVYTVESAPGASASD